LFIERQPVELDLQLLSFHAGQQRQRLTLGPAYLAARWRVETVELRLADLDLEPLGSERRRWR